MKIQISLSEEKTAGERLADFLKGLGIKLKVEDKRPYTYFEIVDPAFKYKPTLVKKIQDMLARLKFKSSYIGKAGKVFQSQDDCTAGINTYLEPFFWVSVPQKASFSADVAADDSWFTKLPEAEQKEYIEKHPKSRFAKLHQQARITVKQLHREQHAFFHGAGNLPGSKPRRSFGQFIKDKAHGVVKVLKHEVKEFKVAGHAVADFAHGKKLDDHQKKAIKGVLVHGAMVLAPLAISGGLSLGIAHCLPHLAGGFLEHTLVSTTARAAVFASDADPMEKLLTGFAEYVANHKLTDDEWKAAFDAAKQDAAK